MKSCENTNISFQDGKPVAYILACRKYMYLDITLFVFNIVIM